MKKQTVKFKLKIVLKAFLCTIAIYLIFFFGGITAMFATSLLEEAIGSQYNCHLGEGAVLVSLSCPNEPNEKYRKLEDNSAVFNGILGFTAIVLWMLLFNPICFIIIMFIVWYFLYLKSLKQKLVFKY